MEDGKMTEGCKFSICSSESKETYIKGYSSAVFRKEASDPDVHKASVKKPSRDFLEALANVCLRYIKLIEMSKWRFR